MSLKDVLQEIYDEHGTLTPAIVLEEARSPAHPLHDKFEWDDSEAAEKYRKHQAGQLIRRARIVYKEGTEYDGPSTVRAFHSLPEGEGRAYRPAEEIASDPILTEMVMRQMDREWKTMRRRYGNFEDFWKLVQRDIEENGNAQE